MFSAFRPLKVEMAVTEMTAPERGRVRLADLPGHRRERVDPSVIDDVDRGIADGPHRGQAR